MRVLDTGMLARGRGVLAGSATASEFDPASLFSSGEAGGYWAAWELASMFEERSSPSTASSVDGVVGTLNDLSGNGNHRAALADNARPILRESGGFYAIEHDGVDDSLVVSGIDLAAVDDGWSYVFVGNMAVKLFSGNGSFKSGGIGYGNTVLTTSMWSSPSGNEGHNNYRLIPTSVTGPSIADPGPAAGVNYISYLTKEASENGTFGIKATGISETAAVSSAFYQGQAGDHYTGVGLYGYDPGDFGALLLIDRDLTADELNNVITLFASKAGITL